jgi:membrane protease YdiL (CAAX protease family)
VTDSASARQIEREWADIAFVLKFYGSLLAVQIVTALTAAHAGRMPAFVAGNAALLLATAVALSMRWKLVRDCVVRPTFPLPLVGLVLAAAVPIYLLVAVVVHGLSVAFSSIDKGYLSDFRGVHVGWAYLIVAVNAAVIEELAFRGVVFTVLTKYLRLGEATIVTSVAFAILHLSVLGLLTHVALGAYLCWLRQRSASVYPGILAHFLHNTLVLANEQFRFLPGLIAPG